MEGPVAAMQSALFNINSPTSSSSPSLSEIENDSYNLLGLIPRLIEKILTDSRSVLKALKDGQKYRTVAKTNANLLSSRSHACFDIFIKQKTINISNSSSTTIVSRLRLMDLAGSGIVYICIIRNN